jgi:hypothetical protein
MSAASISSLALSAVIALAFSAVARAQGVSTATKAWCAQAVPALRQALRIAPAASAERAIAANDLRYLEWYGIGSAVPGVKNQACVREARILKPFEGTSDALCSEEHRALYEQSHAYAEAYNERIAEARKARGLVNCNDA